MIGSPWSPLGLRRRRTPHPTDPVSLVLASTGQPISPAAIDRAASLAEGRPATVVSIARIHGSAFGLPNPGLLPTRRERDAQREIVSDAITALRQRRLDADGEVIVTRNAIRAISGVVRRRAADAVVIDAPRQGRLRRFLEGDPAHGLRRRLRNQAAVIVVRSPDGDPPIISRPGVWR